MSHFDELDFDEIDIIDKEKLNKYLNGFLSEDTESQLIEFVKSIKVKIDTDVDKQKLYDYLYETSNSEDEVTEYEVLRFIKDFAILIEFGQFDIDEEDEEMEE